LTKSSHFLEYIKIYLISLEQDLEKYSSEDDIGYLETSAAISATEHLLSVATDIMNSSNERE